MILRARHLAARKGLESLLRKAMDENNELRKTVAELSNQLQRHEDDGKLIRPATMQETSKILVTK